MSKKHIICLLVSSIIACLNAQEPPTIYANYTDTPIVLDGKMDEDVWTKAKESNSFWQYFPTDSILAKYSTSIKIVYDDDNLYVGMKAEGVDSNFVVSSLKRDFFGPSTDNVSVVFDTFKDRINAYTFGASPYGVQREALLSEGGSTRNSFNPTWDIKWYAESTINDNHYTVEMSIPFSSIKYPEGSKSWRFQAYRFNLQSNELSTWARVDQSQILVNLGFFGTLEFEKPLKKSKTPLYVIPYINGLASKDFELNQTNKSFAYGGDAKIAIGNGMNLDVTVNPDFSNVEVDDIIANLTRFEISLPEKRQFFIDNNDLFGGYGSFRDAIPFFSRRIGIAKDSAGNTIQNKIIGGVRLSGKLDQDWRLGFLSIQNQEDLQNQIASNNNTMLTLQRRIFSRSQIGVFAINRQAFKEYDFLSEEDKFNTVVGFDSNLVSPDNTWSSNIYMHKSYQPGDNKGNLSSRIRVQYNTREWRIFSDAVFVDRDFRSDLGFIPRNGIVKQGSSVGRTFYPKTGKINSHNLRVFNFMWFSQELNYKKTDHNIWSFYEIEFKNQSKLELQSRKQYVFLIDAFDPTNSEDGIPIPGDKGYNFTEWGVSYESNVSKPISIINEFTYGSFFNGKRLSYSGTGLMRIQPRFLLTLQWDFNRVVLPNPYPTANIVLVSPKVEYTFSKKLFWSTLIQFSNQMDNLGINSRLQWRFAPLSDLFLVYNDNYYTHGTIQPNFRSINLKLTYWLNL